jgi:hypothetical protein
VHRRRSLALYLPASLRKREQEETHRGLTTHSGPPRENTILADGLQIQAERDSNNNAREIEAPPVLPLELVKIRTGIFIKEVVDQYPVHLGKHWSQDMIDRVECDHRDLRVAYAREPNVKAAFDKHDEVFFNEAWDVVKGRFNDLRQFCSGLETAFPNIISVESDFSFVKWEKNDTRTSLTSLPLAGIMQAKQFDLLKDLF